MSSKKTRIRDLEDTISTPCKCWLTIHLSHCYVVLSFIILSTTAFLSYSSISISFSIFSFFSFFYFLYRHKYHHYYYSCDSLYTHYIIWLIDGGDSSLRSVSFFFFLPSFPLLLIHDVAIVVIMTIELVVVIVR